MITVLKDGRHVEWDETTLLPNHSITDTEDHTTEVTEWLFQDGTIAHRSVHVIIKKGLGIEHILGQLG